MNKPNLFRAPKEWSLADISKGLAVVAVGFGFHFLRAYCAQNSVPFPMSLSELPVLLSTVAAIALFFVVIAAGFIMLPALNSLGRYESYQQALDRLLDGGKWPKFWLRCALPLAALSYVPLGVVLSARVEEPQWHVLAIIAAFFYGILAWIWILKHRSDGDFVPMILLFGFLWMTITSSVAVLAGATRLSTWAAGPAGANCGVLPARPVVVGCGFFLRRSHQACTKSSAVRGSVYLDVALVVRTSGGCILWRPCAQRAQYGWWPESVVLECQRGSA